MRVQIAAVPRAPTVPVRGAPSSSSPRPLGVGVAVGSGLPPSSSAPSAPWASGRPVAGTAGASTLLRLPSLSHAPVHCRRYSRVPRLRAKGRHGGATGAREGHGRRDSVVGLRRGRRTRGPSWYCPWRRVGRRRSGPWGRRTGRRRREEEAGVGASQGPSCFGGVSTTDRRRPAQRRTQSTAGRRGVSRPYPVGPSRAREPASRARTKAEEQEGERECRFPAARLVDAAPAHPHPSAKGTPKVRPQAPRRRSTPRRGRRPPGLGVLRPRGSAPMTPEAGRGGGGRGRGRRCDSDKNPETPAQRPSALSLIAGARARGRPPSRGRNRSEQRSAGPVRCSIGVVTLRGSIDQEGTVTPIIGPNNVVNLTVFLTSTLGLKSAEILLI